MGGVIVVASTPQEGPGTHGAVQADVIDAAAMLRTAITPRIHAAAALRGSYLDRSFDLVSDRDVGDLFPIPKYRDGQLQLSVQLPNDARLDLVGLFAGDEIARTVTTSDPSITKRDDRDTFFYRTWARYTGRTRKRRSRTRSSGSAATTPGGEPVRRSRDVAVPERPAVGFRGSWRARTAVASR